MRMNMTIRVIASATTASAAPSRGCDRAFSRRRVTWQIAAARRRTRSACRMARGMPPLPLLLLLCHPPRRHLRSGSDQGRATTSPGRFGRCPRANPFWEILMTSLNRLMIAIVRVLLAVRSSEASSSCVRSIEASRESTPTVETPVFLEDPGCLSIQSLACFSLSIYKYPRFLTPDPWRIMEDGTIKAYFHIEFSDSSFAWLAHLPREVAHCKLLNVPC
mmetsp:Transcript_47032/g.142409  ORF Transcript_47032/g.142409 Transcript_47032/m.142409 type:complete len:219 (+) Transcript_47032:664-1320(+)